MDIIKKLEHVFTITGTIIFKHASKSDDDDRERRFITALASVEVVDTQGDLVDVESLAKSMEIYKKRGGPLLVEHSNLPVGRLVSYEIVTTEGGVKALKCDYEIFNHYPFDDHVWKSIVEGKFTGLSIAGMMKGKRTCNEQTCFNHVHHVDLLEVSLVRSPANKKSRILSHDKVIPSSNADSGDLVVTPSTELPVTASVKSEGSTQSSSEVKVNMSDPTVEKKDENCEDCPKEKTEEKVEPVDLGLIIKSLENISSTLAKINERVEKLEQKSEDEPKKENEEPPREPEPVTVKTSEPQPQPVTISPEVIKTVVSEVIEEKLAAKKEEEKEEEVVVNTPAPSLTTKSASNPQFIDLVPIPGTSVFVSRPGNWDVVRKSLPPYVLTRDKLIELAAKNDWETLEACALMMMKDLESENITII